LKITFCVASAAPGLRRLFCPGCWPADQQGHLWLREKNSWVIVGIVALLLQAQKCIAKPHNLVGKPQRFALFTGTSRKAMFQGSVHLPPGWVITPGSSPYQPVRAGLGQLSSGNDQLMGHPLPAPQGLLFGEENTHMAETLFASGHQLLAHTERNISKLFGIEGLLRGCKLDINNQNIITLVR
jgi:hypothetical protein